MRETSISSRVPNLRFRLTRHRFRVIAISGPVKFHRAFQDCMKLDEITRNCAIVPFAACRVVTLMVSFAHAANGHLFMHHEFGAGKCGNMEGAFTWSAHHNKPL